MKRNVLRFTFPLAILLFSFTACLVLIEKGDVVLYLNEQHDSLLNLSQLIITKSIEFPFILILLVPLFFYKRAISILAAISYCVAGVIAQFFKRAIFNQEFRPFHFYQELHIVDGVEMITQNSFPSGHTTVAFAVGVVLYMTIENPIIRGLSILWAASVGFSRIYLGLHFYRDVVAGAWLGSFIAFLCCVLLYKRLHNRPLQQKILEKAQV